jgi:hypothetical protein
MAKLPSTDSTSPLLSRTYVFEVLGAKAELPERILLHLYAQALFACETVTAVLSGFFGKHLDWFHLLAHGALALFREGSAPTLRSLLNPMVIKNPVHGHPRNA